MTAIDLIPIIRIVHRTIREARDAGNDYASQTRQAVLAVIEARPDIPAHEAFTFVQGVRNGDRIS